jgi:hypothetical protein
LGVRRSCVQSTAIIYDMHQPIDYSQLELFDNLHSNEVNLMDYNSDDSNFTIDPGYDLDKTKYDNKSYESDNQLSTAVSKVQIKLNNLINNHKAAIKLYNDIIQLFNDYISSPNSDPYAKLGTPLLPLPLLLHHNRCRRI